MEANGILTPAHLKILITHFWMIDNKMEGKD